MRCLIPFLVLASLALDGQEVRTYSSREGTAHVLVEVHQVTPESGLREANSRGGWGGQLGFEAADFRFVAETGGFPAQAEWLAGAPATRTVVTWGLGFDYLLRISEHRDAGLYLLGGLHFDNWSGGVETPEGRDSDHSSHLGLRLGAGLRLGPVFGEIRYRLTEGDIRVASTDPRWGGGWGAVEVGMGLRF